MILPVQSPQNQTESHYEVGVRGGGGASTDNPGGAEPKISGREARHKRELRT